MACCKEAKKPVKRSPSISSLPESNNWKGKRITFAMSLMVLYLLISKQNLPEIIASMLQALEKPLQPLATVPD
jgi:hypothetical protein